jgi:hypothetical protein
MWLYISTSQYAFVAQSLSKHRNNFIFFLRISPFGLLRRVALVRTDVSEDHVASIIRVTRIGGLGKTLAVTSNRSTLRKNTLRFSA